MQSVDATLLKHPLLLLILLTLFSLVNLGSTNASLCPSVHYFLFTEAYECYCSLSHVTYFIHEKQ